MTNLLAEVASKLIDLRISFVFHQSKDSITSRGIRIWVDQNTGELRASKFSGDGIELSVAKVIEYIEE